MLVLGFVIEYFIVTDYYYMIFMVSLVVGFVYIKERVTPHSFIILYLVISLSYCSTLLLLVLCNLCERFFCWLGSFSRDVAFTI